MKIKSLIAGLLLLTSCVASAQTYKYESVPNDPMGARIYTLNNGLKVYLSVNKEKPRIQTYIAVRTGSRNDPHETTGLAHYLEHLMFKGTTHFGASNAEAEKPLLDSIEHRFEVYRTITDSVKRRAYYHEIDSISQLAAKYNIPNEYDKMMSSIGSEGSDAWTGNDETVYQEDIPSNEIDTWAKVQADRFRNMVIRGFHTELEAVYEEYNINIASDGYKAFNAMLKKLCPTHPYGTQSTIGLPEHLKNPSITNIKKYFHKYYEPNNIAIMMAGDFDPDKTIATIDKYFGNWKGYGKVEYPQYEAQPMFTTPQDTSVIGQDAEYLLMAWRFNGANSQQQDTLDVINQLLCNGKAGLFDVDLNQPMKVQSIDDGLYGLHDYSVLYIIAQPKEGQSLDDLRKLTLAEIDKMKKGEFSDELLPAIVNNYKRYYYQQLDRNDFRTDQFVDAFINEKKWSNVVGHLDRLSKITKKDIVDFANKYFNDGYACVYKLQGKDTTLHRVDKPQITPIPTNNDKESDFKHEIVNSKPEPIQPQFLDFKKDLTTATSKRGLDILYKQNKENDLFTLQFRIPFGTESDPRYNNAAGYLEYVGTDKLTSQQIKEKFYEMACDYSISEGSNETYITLNGLGANMPQALALLNNLIMNAKADTAQYNKYVAMVLKDRADAKTSQDDNARALMNYGMMGAYNPYRNIMSEQELKAENPQALLDKLKELINYKQTVLYYGPMNLSDLDKLISKTIKTPKTFKPLPASKSYEKERTDSTEIYLANYEAPNAIMYQFHNEDKPWSPDQEAVENIFNYYYGGMNGIVFQELREARGLAYSASSRYVHPNRKQDKEYFFTYIVTQTDKLMDCIKEFNTLLDSMPQHPINFDLAKQNVMKDIATERYTKFNILTRYYWLKQMGLDHDYQADVYKATPTLTMQDIVNFSRQNIANKAYRYIILGDEKVLDMKSLEKIAPIHKLTTEEIFGY